uniref:Alpha-1A adrenergic receptor-like n=1 Tax=Callorhinchus milii TaxID=7868 RepID=A0A4W3GTA8_CALMI
NNLTRCSEWEHCSLTFWILSCMVGPPDHSTCSICCCTPVNRILTVIFMILLTIAVLFGNSVSLVVFLGTKQFRTPHGYLKASLAVADLAVGVFLITIFLLTIERSIAILKPLHKEAVITRKRTVSLIGVSWIASFFLAVSPLMFSEEIVLEYNTCSRMCNFSLLAGSFPQSGWKILLLFPAFDFTLLGATVVINILSLSSIRQYSKQRRVLAKSNHSCRLSRPSFSDIKAGKTIGALTLAFTASFTPIAVYVVGNVLGYQWCEFSFIAFWILTSNSCWNVIIYSVRDQKFRQRSVSSWTDSGPWTASSPPQGNSLACSVANVCSNNNN